LESPTEEDSPVELDLEDKDIMNEYRNPYAEAIKSKDEKIGARKLKEYLVFCDIEPPNIGKVMRIVAIVRIRTIFVIE
jgi:hypothetical protein